MTLCLHWLICLFIYLNLKKLRYKWHITLCKLHCDAFIHCNMITFIMLLNTPVMLRSRIIEVPSLITKLSGSLMQQRQVSEFCHAHKHLWVGTKTTIIPVFWKLVDVSALYYAGSLIRRMNEYFYQRQNVTESNLVRQVMGPGLRDKTEMNKSWDLFHPSKISKLLGSYSNITSSEGICLFLANEHNSQ